jgi:hypothetical protein
MISEIVYLSTHDMRGRNNKANLDPPISLGADKPWMGGVNPVEATVKPSLERFGLPGASMMFRAVGLNVAWVGDDRATIHGAFATRRPTQADPLDAFNRISTRAGVSNVRL